MRPSAASRNAASVVVSTSMTLSSSAFSAVTETLSRTARCAHSALRPRWRAIDSANAAVSFSIFSARCLPPSSGSEPEGPTTGWAAPMFEPGAIPATWPAIVTNTPALPARAPAGPTQTSTGTSEPRNACTICRVPSSEPPGVSTRTSSASSFCASARLDAVDEVRGRARVDGCRRARSGRPRGARSRRAPPEAPMARPRASRAGAPVLQFAGDASRVPPVVQC